MIDKIEIEKSLNDVTKLGDKAHMAVCLASNEAEDMYKKVSNEFLSKWHSKESDDIETIESNKKRRESREHREQYREENRVVMNLREVRDEWLGLKHLLTSTLKKSSELRYQYRDSNNLARKLEKKAAKDKLSKPEA